MNSYLESKIGCELKLLDKRADKQNKKRKKGNPNGVKRNARTTTSIDEWRTFRTKWSGYNANLIKELKWIQLTVLGAEKIVGDFEWPKLTQLTVAPEQQLPVEPVVPDQSSVISTLTVAQEQQQTVLREQSSEDSELPAARKLLFRKAMVDLVLNSN